MGLAVSYQRTAYTAMFFSFFFYFDSDGGTALGETLNSAGSDYAIRSKNCDSEITVNISSTTRTRKLRYITVSIQRFAFVI